MMQPGYRFIKQTGQLELANAFLEASGLGRAQGADDGASMGKGAHGNVQYNLRHVRSLFELLFSLQLKLYRRLHEFGAVVPGFQGALAHTLLDGALASCTICKHPSKEHRHYKEVHVQTGRERDVEKLARQLESAETEEQQLPDAKDASEPRITEV
ncbi:hypothetical protein RhiJN_27140 [Ceratobasidium sp. AG-Ba]|nr:hypothetical protein RhiJN_27140 [Ceratobasidium sp. AG-Ba]